MGGTAKSRLHFRNTTIIANAFKHLNKNPGYITKPQPTFATPNIV